MVRLNIKNNNLTHLGGYLGNPTINLRIKCEIILETPSL